MHLYLQYYTQRLKRGLKTESDKTAAMVLLWNLTIRWSPSTLCIIYICLDWIQNAYWLFSFLLAAPLATELCAYKGACAVYVHRSAWIKNGKDHQSNSNVDNGGDTQTIALEISILHIKQLDCTPHTKNESWDMRHRLLLAFFFANQINVRLPRAPSTAWRGY